MEYLEMLYMLDLPELAIRRKISKLTFLFKIVNKLFTQRPHSQHVHSITPPVLCTVPLTANYMAELINIFILFFLMPFLFRTTYLLQL